MHLRAANEDDDAKFQEAATRIRIETLRRSLGPVPSAEDARARLDLAGELAWLGHYRPTLELIQPLVTGDFPSAIAYEARHMIADTHYRHDQYDLAHRQYAENLEIAREANDETQIANARCGHAWVLIDVGHYTSGEFNDALSIFEETAPLYRQQGRHIAEAMSIYGISRAAAGIGQYDKAIDFAERCLATLESHRHSKLVQLPLLQLANVYRDLGAFDRARPYYDQAIDAADRAQDSYVQALSALCYGMLLKYTGEVDCAREWWDNALLIAREWEYPRLGHETCERLAAIASDRGDFEQAYLRQTESQAFGNRVGVISAVLKNQQMLLRAQIDRSSQLERELIYLTAGVEACADGIFVLGASGTGIAEGEFTIEFLNASAAEMIGRPPIDVLHVLLRSVWRSPTAETLIAPSLEVLSTGKRRSLDPVRLEFREGDFRWYAVKIAKIADGVAWTISDVTEREAMQRELVAHHDRLAEANARLTALDREKSEMLGITAHDLRSPIGNIRSLCELITPADADSRELLHTVEGIADGLIGLIGNLLDVERIERGEMELAVTPSDVARLLPHLVNRFSADAKQKDIDIEMRLPKTELVAMADESALRRVVQNLLSNALKFSPPGSRVDVTAARKDQAVRIEIVDQGPGISESDRKRLFSKFTRLSARPTAGESSTGLGLSIVKRLVEAMNGEVGCVSEPGRGACFWVELPAATRP